MPNPKDTNKIMKVILGLIVAGTGILIKKGVDNFQNSDRKSVQEFPQQSEKNK